MAILVPFFQQLTGINVIMFYAPVLFRTIVITGVVNVVSIYLFILTVDKVGRRFLFLVGGIQMLVCQITVGTLIGVEFGTSGQGTMSKTISSFVVTFICIYVAGFAWSWRGLGWFVPSEIFPLEIRSIGQSINVSVKMFFAFLIAQTFLMMLCHLKFGLFYFFGGWVVIMTTFIFFFLPETKNVSIEDEVSLVLA
ncbi:hypothetical protein ZOSMA_103G00590 [Zostera marina]|uniref:Major facilitator superfamily (MFS) profile domain-containing protein n=1 Tax=Zostera marina TaxID=29655 RepID=A0A0K9Q4Z9_ZOSMR|nr:hypothetical protein ZOSMA_103G00590 [Zostera marina]